MFGPIYPSLNFGLLDNHWFNSNPFIDDDDGLTALENEHDRNVKSVLSTVDDRLPLHVELKLLKERLIEDHEENEDDFDEDENEEDENDEEYFSENYEQEEEEEDDEIGIENQMQSLVLTDPREMFPLSTAIYGPDDEEDEDNDESSESSSQSSEQESDQDSSNSESDRELVDSEEEAELHNARTRSEFKMNRFLTRMNLQAASNSFVDSPTSGQSKPITSTATHSAQIEKEEEDALRRLSLVNRTPMNLSMNSSCLNDSNNLNQSCRSGNLISAQTPNLRSAVRVENVHEATTTARLLHRNSLRRFSTHLLLNSSANKSTGRRLQFNEQDSHSSPSMASSTPKVSSERIADLHPIDLRLCSPSVLLNQSPNLINLNRLDNRKTTPISGSQHIDQRTPCLLTSMTKFRQTPIISRLANTSISFSPLL